MIAFTASLFIVLLVTTSQYIHAYPSASSSIGTKNNQPINLRLKRDLGLLQHHQLTNSYNDLPYNFDENFPYIYSMVQRRNLKRLIDF